MFYNDEKNPADNIVLGIGLGVISAVFIGLYIGSLEASFYGGMEGTTGFLAVAALTGLASVVAFCVGLHQLVSTLHRAAMNVTADTAARLNGPRDTH